MAAGEVVANCLNHMLAIIENGMSTRELDNEGAKFLARFGANSAPILTYGFPGSTCISINNEAAHGIPLSSTIIKSGDLINIDVSAELNGFFADTGASFLLDSQNPLLVKLCDATKMALDLAISKVKTGNMLNLIGKAIEDTAMDEGFTVIENICSHGTGRSLHEEPDSIWGFYNRQDKRVLQEGMVFTIEPFLSTATLTVKEADDGWTLLNDPMEFSAQYEHTMICTADGPIITTLPTRGEPFTPQIFSEA